MDGNRRPSCRVVTVAQRDVTARLAELDETGASESSNEALAADLR